ncbi:MAG: IS1634 family transposase [Cuniculiplasma sp.]|jgi:transposase
MPFLVWKTIGGKKRLVMRWNKRVDGKPKVVKEIYIGDMEKLARIIEHPDRKVDAYSLSYGVTASILLIERDVQLKNIVNGIMGTNGSGMSPGDYFLLFIMNRLSDPESKNGIERWIRGDFASTIYPKRGSQDYWNFMDRITDGHMEMIMNMIKEKVLTMGYDFSRIFVDASNMYTFMGENEMAKKGHNKKHRYDLNQVSYYIGSNYDYIPLFWNSYAGNIHDSKTFPEMVKHMPENATIIFDRGYNSKDNIDILKDRKYIGALILSDHKDLVDLQVGNDSFIETRKKVYGKDHRILVYHSSKLQNKRVRTFMKSFRKVYMKAKRLVESGDSDAMEQARFFLESKNLNETIILPDMHINSERMSHRIRMLGLNALFTNIEDMQSNDIIDLYRKRNRVEHCFRTINTMSIAFPLYHWTPQKIKVHMFMSLLAYLFLSLLYNRIMKETDEISLISTQDILKGIRVQYIIDGKDVKKTIDAKDPEQINICEKLNLISLA